MFLQYLLKSEEGSEVVISREMWQDRLYLAPGKRKDINTVKLSFVQDK